MNIKQGLILLTVLAGLLTPVIYPSIALADSSSDDTLRTVNTKDELSCKKSGGKGVELTEENCGIITIVKVTANILGGIAALVIVLMIVWGGIQYSAAGADPNKVQAAKQKIINALLALLLFIFGFAFLQWLIPGGALNGFQ